MRYTIELCENPDFLIIHLDKVVVKTIEHYESPDDCGESEQARLVRNLFGIEGVCGIFLNRYSISIDKGSVFDWTEMTSAILHTLQINLCPNEEIAESKKPFMKTGCVVPSPAATGRQQ